MSSGIREISAAGTWYPEDGEVLLRHIENLLIDFRPDDNTTLDASVVLLPHSSFAYTAECACRTLARIDIPDRVLILHTRHVESALGPAYAPYTGWRTPLATTTTSLKLNEAIERAGLAVADEACHEEEHAPEVLLPLFQVLNKDVQIAVISVPHLTREATREFGKSLGKLLADQDEDTLLVVASDLHHYDDRRTTERIDDLILERIEFFDAEGLMDVAEREDARFFGVSHVAAALIAAKALGCEEVEIVHHTDSGEAEGQIDEVIGYASGFLR
ncbi:MAG: AmmeMemoRadiSam system protein B [Planctomycetes bacterium]|nr:AmmeMemoRadiSam system protein B [Planctomycetota bacterium]